MDNPVQLGDTTSIQHHFRTPTVPRWNSRVTDDHETDASDMLGSAKRVTWKGTSVAERPEFHAGTLAH